MKNLYLEVLKDWSIKDIELINNEAFESYEKMPIKLLKGLCKRDDVDTFLIKENNRTIGFCTIAWNKDMLYVIFFAIKDTLRNKGYGKEVLKLLKKKQKELCSNGIIILDCHEPNSTINKRRLNFYKRNGFNEIRKKTITEDANYIWLYYGDMPQKSAKKIFNKNYDYLFDKNIWLILPKIEDY